MMESRAPPSPRKSSPCCSSPTHEPTASTNAEHMNHRADNSDFDKLNNQNEDVSQRSVCNCSDDKSYVGQRTAPDSYDVRYFSKGNAEGTCKGEQSIVDKRSSESAVSQQEEDGLAKNFSDVESAADMSRSAAPHGRRREKEDLLSTETINSKVDSSRSSFSNCESLTFDHSSSKKVDIPASDDGAGTNNGAHTGKVAFSDCRRNTDEEDMNTSGELTKGDAVSAREAETEKTFRVGEADGLSVITSLPLKVKLMSGEMLNVTVDPSITVDDWRQQLQPRVNILPVEQRLVASGRVLQGCRTISSYTLSPNSTVHLLRNPSTASAAASGAAGGVSPVSASSQNISFNGSEGARGISSAQIRGLGQNSPELLPFFAPPSGEDGNSQQGDLLQQLLQSSVMQQLTETPDFLRMLFESNPEMQQLREQNPELNHLLTDPQIFQQSVQMVRNPALQREMMRSTDRAMANIEALPGGFNALMRMYHTIQEPMFEATFNAASSCQNPESSSSATGAGGSTTTAADVQKQICENQRNRTTSVEAMPNPWAEPSVPLDAASRRGAARENEQLDQFFGGTSSSLFPGLQNSDQASRLMNAMFSSNASPAGGGLSWGWPQLSSAVQQPPQQQRGGASALSSSVHRAVASGAAAQTPLSASIEGGTQVAAVAPAAQPNGASSDLALGSGATPSQQQQPQRSSEGNGLQQSFSPNSQSSNLFLMDLLRSSFRNSLDVNQLEQQMNRMALSGTPNASNTMSHEQQQQQLQQQQRYVFAPFVGSGNPFFSSSAFAPQSTQSHMSASGGAAATQAALVGHAVEGSRAAETPVTSSSHLGDDSIPSGFSGDTTVGAAREVSTTAQVPASAGTRYEVQLGALRAMGFTDTLQCIRALDRSGGNINRAIDLLLDQQGNLSP